MHLFLNSVDRAKVVVSTEPVLDKDGHQQTAVFYKKKELRKIYHQKGKSILEAEAILGRLEKGLIVVNERRFKDELAHGIPALATVFHEFVRATGVDDDNYRRTASNYDLEFFERLHTNSSENSKSVPKRCIKFRRKPLAFAPTDLS